MQVSAGACGAILLTWLEGERGRPHGRDPHPVGSPVYKPGATQGGHLFCDVDHGRIIRVEQLSAVREAHAGCHQVEEGPALHICDRKIIGAQHPELLLHDEDRLLGKAEAGVDDCACTEEGKAALTCGRRGRHVMIPPGGQTGERRRERGHRRLKQTYKDVQYNQRVERREAGTREGEHSQHRD